MKVPKFFFFSILFLLLLLFLTNAALANKASVAIEAPSEIPKGSDIVIRLTVTHSADSYFHYVEWLKIWVNGEEMNRWIFSASKRPEGATFTKEIKIMVNDILVIKAEASCNIHGSNGPISLKVLAK